MARPSTSPLPPTVHPSPEHLFCLLTLCLQGTAPLEDNQPTKDRLRPREGLFAASPGGLPPPPPARAASGPGGGSPP
eukprot:13378636-Alexandrium_andersonii.AAC.1